MWEIRFSQSALSRLRQYLLEDLSKEYFAVGLGRYETIGDQQIIICVDFRLPGQDDYKNHGLAHLSLQKEFTYEVLREISDRVDVDAIIDMHTHPFASECVAFSGVDDRDEIQFRRFLTKHFEGLHYASIVFSQKSYDARVIVADKKGRSVSFKDARIKAPTRTERILHTSAFGKAQGAETRVPEFLARSSLLYDAEILRDFVTDSHVTVIGVGGLGSIVSENLVHNGFHSLTLVDQDNIEESNLNRIVGATFKDAKDRANKVDALARHLKGINPEVVVESIPDVVESPRAIEGIARSDWVFICTDNHSSRQAAQQACMRYCVPFISTGVNITVENGLTADVSGEVVLVRPGDHICLDCLWRLDPNRVAFERNRAGEIGATMIRRGYFSGADVKEPAVKSLNAIVACIATDALIGQFTAGRPVSHILVYDGTGIPKIYEDERSLKNRKASCATCHGYPRVLLFPMSKHALLLQEAEGSTVPEVSSADRDNAGETT